MTTKTERFFVWVWRINALVLLPIAILALIGVGMISHDMGIFSKVAGADLVAAKPRLGSFGVIAGTDYVYAELAVPSRDIRSGSSDDLGTARNLLFFHTKSKKAHWLFDNTDSDILSWKMVYNEPRQNMTDEKESRLYVVGMIVELADHEDEPSPDRLRGLVFVSADGKKVSPLIESIDSQLGQYHTDSDTVLIFYVRDGSVNVLDVDTTNVVVRSDFPLSGED